MITGGLLKWLYVPRAAGPTIDTRAITGGAHLLTNNHTKEEWRGGNCGEREAMRNVFSTWSLRMITPRVCAPFRELQATEQML